MEDSNGPRHRRAASRSVMPLAIIAGSFFLPTLRTCQTVQSPMEVAADGLVWVIPWYLAAFVLAVVTGIAALKLRTPGRPGWIAGSASVVACGFVAVTGLIMFAVRLAEGPIDPPLLFALGVLITSLGVGGIGLRGARTRRGWPAWTRLLLAYWGFLLPLLGLFGLHALDGGPDGMGLGAYFVLLAATTLGVILGGALVVDRTER